jgi:hypothetical protein
MIPAILGFLVVLVVMMVVILVVVLYELRQLWRANDELQRRLVAMVDKAALYVSDTHDDAPPGKVSFMDDKRMVELENAAS